MQYERPLITCLSEYDEELVRELAGQQDVYVRLPTEATNQEQVPGFVADADIVIGDAARRFVLDRTAVQAMQRCRLIEQPSVGYDTVDVVAAAERGIPVAHAPGYNADAVADWVVMAVLNTLRQGAAADATMRAGEWSPWPLGSELGSLTVGVVGMGQVGTGVARRVQAFGSSVLFTARTRRHITGARQVELPDLLRYSDIVSLHLPLTADTRGLIGSVELAEMQQGAILVNASRGPIMDEDALVDALREGRLAGAALDVFEAEPLPANSALRSLPQVYLSPHIAGGTHQARQRVRAMVADNLRRVLRGGAAEHVVIGHAAVSADQSSATAAVHDWPALPSGSPDSGS